MQELDHSPLGGSAAHRFLTCKGSFLLQRELYEAGELEISDSYFARKGTAAHTLASTALEEDQEPFMYIGQTFDGFTVVSDDEEDEAEYGEDRDQPDTIKVGAVQVYFNACQKVATAKGRKLIEERITLPDLHPLLKGQVDFGHLSRSGVTVIDYKNGEGLAVAAAGNPQLLYYGFLLTESNAWWRESAPKDLPVTLMIVQPNFYGEFSEPEEWVTTIGEVQAWGYETLLPAMRRLTATQDIARTDFTHGNHCTFCPVILDCPLMQEAWRAYAKAQDTEFLPMLTNDELDAFYAMRDAVKKFGNELDKAVETRLEDGSEFKHAKLVDKRGRRVWKNGAETALAKTFGESAYAPRKLKSPAQIEKLSSLGKEKALEFSFKNEDTGRTVAPMSDPRPASVSKASSKIFAHVLDQEYDL